ncbi:MAG: acyltransferase [Rhodobacteraceae bacterium]|nr:acyltransferase [Paracoccaceae bacterium]
MILGDGLRTRDNNLNLIRFLAATAVLVSHAWPMTRGRGTAEPLQGLTGLSLGEMAVCVFFAASGFLIAASLDRRPAPVDFLRARAARLVPGLAVSLLLVTFALGPAVSTRPAETYLASPDTWEFLIRNLTLVRPAYELETVFETNPLPIVEGSIWTLRFEVACYALLAAAGFSGLMASRPLATAVLLGWLAVTLARQAGALAAPYEIDRLLMLSQPFALGALAFLWRDRLPLSFALLALLAMAAAFAPAAVQPAALVLALSYGTLVLAVRPAGRIRAFNRAGDYSYGIYIYAVPVQALVVWALGPMTPAWHIVVALPATLALAVLSWHLVEAPALAAARERSARRQSQIARPERTDAAARTARSA